MDVFGLPDWVPRMAGLICLMALPLVLATAIVQKATTNNQLDTPEAEVPWARRWLTWKRVGLVIPMAFALLLSPALTKSRRWRKTKVSTLNS